MNLLFISLGCDKNLVDSEVMLGILRAHGFTLVDDEIEADIIVVNTCSFIHDAKEESIQTILEMAEMKHSCRCKALIVTGCMAERYKDEIMTEIEEVELEPSLGNGGLGRLAACFLDSIATLGLNGDGVGLNYHDGLFLQKFSDNKQWEEKNPWITEKSWLTKTDVSFEVPFKDFTLKSTMYDIDVPGYQSGCNKLHLFDLDSVDESIIGNGIQFDKQEIHKNLTLFLYPDDSDEACVHPDQ